MNDLLKTYLHDHLAGARLAIELLERMLQERMDESLYVSLTSVLAEIIEDRESLETLANHAGVGTSRIKEGAAWVAERLSELKLTSADSETFEFFQALEIVGLGIQGKLQLWRALERVSATHEGFGVADFSELVRRGERQYAAVEDRRLALAELSFTKS